MPIMPAGPPLIAVTADATPEAFRLTRMEALVALPQVGKGIAAAIAEILHTGRWTQVDRLRGVLDAEHLFQTVPGIGPELALRIHDSLHLDTLEALETAAHDGRLESVPGVSETEDDMPYGREQLIYDLTPAGKALGLTVAELGQQLRTAYDGRLAQIFQDGDREIEVRVMLPDAERYRLTALEDFSVFLPNGGTVALLSAVDLEERRGFKAVRHADAALAVGQTEQPVTALARAVPGAQIGRGRAQQHHGPAFAAPHQRQVTGMVAGLLVVIPLYLAILLLLKAMHSSDSD